MREPRAPHPTAHETPPTDDTFDDRIDHLVALRLTAQEAERSGDDEAATLAAATSQVAWRDLLATTRAPGDKALTRLTHSDPTIPRAAQARQQILLAALTAGLASRSRDARATGNRGPLDYLVTAILVTITHQPRLRATLTERLVDRPYLGLRHEEAVDRLVQDSRVTSDRSTASALLSTLWTNLMATDARSETEITGLALLYRDDANPARRLSAMRHLLNADRGRYRKSVHRQVAREQDQWLAGQLGLEARAHYGAR